MCVYKGSLGAAITGGLREEVTAWAGAAVLAELYRKAGVEAAVERSLPKKKSPKGIRQGQMVEVFVLLSALGGECLEDMERLRTDGGLAALLGYRPPAAETARQWLDRFHDDDLMAQGVQSRFNGIPAYVRSLGRIEGSQSPSGPDVRGERTTDVGSDVGC